MNPIDSNDRLRCEEIACKPSSVFSIVYRFLSGPEADRALALEALFQSLRDVPRKVSDPAVATAKLGWWLAELNSAQSTASQHPVVRLTAATGLLEELGVEVWTRYIQSVSSVLSEPVDDLTGMEHLLRRTGGYESLIIAGMSEADEHAELLVCLGMASRLQSLGSSLTASSTKKDWLPADLRAQADQPVLLTAEVGRLALGYRERAGQQWASELKGPGAGHLLLRSEIEQRRLIRMREHPENFLGGESWRTSLGDVFTAWQMARRIQRSANS